VASRSKRGADKDSALTTNEKGRNPGKDATRKTTRAKFTDNTAVAQRYRLLEALKHGPVTTLEARHGLDILMPATRVHELRHGAGHNIEMLWVDRPTASGNLHRVAMYVLLPPKPITHIQMQPMDLFPELAIA
jgi:Helix-turn-helix domain